MANLSLSFVYSQRPVKVVAFVVYNKSFGSVCRLPVGIKPTVLIVLNSHELIITFSGRMANLSLSVRGSPA
jgi:hypothetical protein